MIDIDMAELLAGERKALSFTHLWAVIPPMRFAVNASLPIDSLLSFHTFQYMLLSTYYLSLVPC